jgi:hypothetical protein
MLNYFDGNDEDEEEENNNNNINNNNNNNNIHEIINRRPRCVYCGVKMSWIS